MQTVQSYWSGPLFGQKEADCCAGWYSRLSFYMGIALSNLTISKFHSPLTLVTDANGKKLVVDGLGLNYSCVDTALEGFKYEGHGLFALSKIFTYSLMKEAFIHIDNDIFLWQPLDKKFEESQLVVQNFENLADGPYKEAINTIQRDFNGPNNYIDQISTTGITRSVNAGILGGNDINFINDYITEALAFVHRNEKKLHLVNESVLNTIIEQHLFYEIAQQKKAEIDVVLDTCDVEVIWALNLTPVLFQFIHLLGEGKRKKSLCEQVILRMKYHFPDDFEKIVRFYKKSGPIDPKDAEWLDNDLFFRKFDNLSRVYDLLEQTTYADLIQQKFRLKKDVTVKNIISAGQSATAIVSPDMSRVINGWERLLAVFHEPTSVMEIADHIKSKNLYPSITVNRLLFELTNMVTKNAVYDSILEFDN